MKPVTERAGWKLLCRALRGFGAVATAGAAVLAALFAVDAALADVYGGMAGAMGLGRWLAGWLLAVLALCPLCVAVTKRALNSDSWREAISWAATLIWQGARAGLLVAMALLALALLVAGLRL